jgi:hypothetical protein
MEKQNRNSAECDRGELLVSVLYDEASPAERVEFEAHARACASCGDELAAFQRVRGELRGWEVGALPGIRIEIRPGFLERLRQAFAVLPAWARLAAAGACALVVLAALNTRVSVGPGGVSFQASLVPPAAATPVTPAGQPPASPTATQVALTDEQIRKLVVDRCDEVLRARLDEQRVVLSTELDQIQRQLSTAQTAELRQMAARLAAQRRKIDDLQRDLDRQAGYGGADLLFSAVGSEPVPGS